MSNLFIVAELSANHLGSLHRALALVDIAAAAGADAIKTQCYEPSQMADSFTRAQAGPWAGMVLQELYREAHTPHDWHEKLFKRARELGMQGFASVFHRDDVDRMEDVGCWRFKISSFEILDLELIRYAASKGKPMIISTGMADVTEIINAVCAAEEYCAGPDITVLKCTSAYPASVSDANLMTGPHLAFNGRKWGVSDHTLGLVVPVAAVALGASMIEKHLTLRRADGGPDAAFSSEPEEFATMVKACREAASAIGEVRYGPTESEMSSLPLRRKPGGKRGG